MKRGFTLVELSIVLVIIGLLIGGILVARSMTETAQIVKYVRLIQNYDIAINNFKVKYNGLPGDNKIMTPPGNGDGTIGGLSSASSIAMNAERTAAFNHLVQSGFYPERIEKTYADVVTTINQGTNVPMFDDIGALIIYSDSTTGGPAYYIGKMQGASYVSSYSSFYLMYPQYLAWDTKMDDGKVMTGRLVGFGNPCSWMCVMSPQPCGSTYGSPQTCSMAYTMPVD